MPSNLNGKVFYSIKEAAEVCGKSAMVMNSIVRRADLEVKAQKVDPEVKVNGPTSEWVELNGRHQRGIEESVLTAYVTSLATRTTGARSADGRKKYYIRLSDTELEQMKSLFGDAVAASLKKATNYDPARSKAYRIKKAAAERKNKEEAAARV